MEVKSIGNELTTFTITLPCCKNKSGVNDSEEPVSGVMVSRQLKNILSEPDMGEDAVPEKIKKIETFEKDRKTILIVEDEQEIHVLLHELLKEKYRIITANNGLEALQTIEKEIPDLIISDIMMPQMDGIEFCRTIKSDLNFCHIPVILLTAKSSVMHRIEGIESGANSYIPKPFHPRHLEVRIEQLLEERDRIYRHFSQDSDSHDISKLPMQEDDKLFIEKIIQIITQHIDDPDLQADLLEKESGMSSTHFYRKLKQISGLSPGDMIRTLRLKHAAELLRQTSMNVTEVFYQSGFNNRSYFYREFQKMYQLPPKQYQLKHNKKHS
jgi:CheY-like chemotaxis protein